MISALNLGVSLLIKVMLNHNKVYKVHVVYMFNNNVNVVRVRWFLMNVILENFCRRRFNCGYDEASPSQRDLADLYYEGLVYDASFDVYPEEEEEDDEKWI